jgi:dihydroorotate dehydrogenase (NAD+) catalytic subunit
VRLRTAVGEVALESAVMTASGTAGHGDELAAYGELSDLGAIVVKSLAAFEWAGNPPPRVAPAPDSMVNSVGLAGPGVAAWRRDDLPRLLARGATVVGSIWGRSTEEFAAAAEAMHGAEIAALELNASCPNLESGSKMFAHSALATAALVTATARAGVPRWVKLSPNTPQIVEVAAAALAAGAEALVLTNTLSGLVIDVEAGRPVLGAVSGGVSGPAILPVALRAVYECRAAFPDAPIVGVGGVSSGEDAVAMIMAGADAVEVGTASLAAPRAPWRIQRELERWLERHDETVATIKGRAHG